MISRAALLPRICLACRLGLSQRTTGFIAAYSTSLGQRSQRRYVSDFSPQSKERIEALISGALDDVESSSKGKHAKKRQGHRRGKHHGSAATEEELAEWEVQPTATPEASKGVDSDIIERTSDSTQDYSIPETVPGGDSPTQPPSSAQLSSNSTVFRHDLVNRYSLGHDALGKPVEAIIIKNPNRLKKPNKPIPALDGELAATGVPLNWQSVLPPQSPESDSSEEFWENIEEVRPKTTTIVRRKDFNELIEYLVDGFTQEQLVTYFNRGKWDDDWESNKKPAYPWVLKQSAWTAAQSNQWGSLKRKEQQAVMILTAKWKLEIQEHIEGLGRTVLWLSPQVFQLITKPSSGIIERLSIDLLDKSNNERISTKLDECRLGIYTRKSTVATILARLEEVIQTIKSQTVSVEQIEAENLTQPVLEELAKITNTALCYNQKRAELSVSWLPETDVSNGQSEGPADIVVRLLIGRQFAPRNAEVQLLSTTKSSKLKKGVFLTHHRDKRGLAWRDKLRKWSRYVNPIAKTMDTARHPLDFLHNVKLSQSNLTSPEERIEATATFGTILHTEKKIQTARSAKTRLVLLPVIPHPAALTLLTADSAVPSTQKTAIVLHFAADRTLLPQSTSSSPLPQVRLHVPINPFTDLSNFSFSNTSALEAVIPQQHTDILLPDESVDVRFTQMRLVPLDPGQASLQEFFQASEFNLLQGKLRTPSKTTFSIPDQWLPVQRSSTSTEQTTSVPYMFMGLEIHQTIDMEWQGHILRYSSIEAGHHGGQQQKLSLVVGLCSGDSMAVTQEKLRGFLQSAEEIACDVHFSWNAGHKLMQERSVEQFSWDMMDTEYPAEKVSEETSEHPNHRIDILEDKGPSTTKLEDGTATSDSGRCVEDDGALNTLSTSSSWEEGHSEKTQ
ncbi:hypothetical protein QQS21_005283 [Conoideocrella luteorostrata]|uniref:Mitochondrial inner-membrane-bound regulator-domain-containing protein n=1 Tax=Conoideocrella luteorostrata TaxID=1105319 RepID=A0AAJ0CPX9_9HYPO|nr:hypothetical protein QQS21_005283 [Conoideocrella luteorostrata]